MTYNVFGGTLNLAQSNRIGMQHAEIAFNDKTIPDIGVNLVESWGELILYVVGHVVGWNWNEWRQLHSLWSSFCVSLMYSDSV